MSQTQSAERSSVGDSARGWDFFSSRTYTLVSNSRRTQQAGGRVFALHTGVQAPPRQKRSHTASSKRSRARTVPYGMVFFPVPRRQIPRCICATVDRHTHTPEPGTDTYLKKNTQERGSFCHTRLHTPLAAGQGSHGALCNCSMNERNGGAWGKDPTGPTAGGRKRE